MLEIYAPYITDSAISFEIEVPAVAEFAQRIERTLASKHPWLVACDAERLLGYAYASPHRSRPAYRFSVETSVYVAKDAARQGLGRSLYEKLFALLEQQDYQHAFAGVTLPNPASVAFHEQFGFTPIGVFRSVGFKFEQWHDVAWFQRAIRMDPTASVAE